MTPKTKSILFNFIAFVIIFLLFRLTIGIFLKLDGLWLGVISAVIASILAPKFFVVKDDEGKEKLIMKTLFSKEIREL